MTEQEIAMSLSQLLVGNWGKVISSIGVLFVGLVTLTWFIFNTIHKKEVAALQQRISSHEENFSQFSTIMEQRLAMAENDAEKLKEKLLRNLHSQSATKSTEKTHNKDVKSEGNYENHSKNMDDEKFDDYMRGMASIRIESPWGEVAHETELLENEESSKIRKLIDRVSSLSKLLKTINQFY